jgi:hypothetical protein
MIGTWFPAKLDGVHKITWAWMPECEGALIPAPVFRRAGAVTSCGKSARSEMLA